MEMRLKAMAPPSALLPEAIEAEEAESSEVDHCDCCKVCGKPERLCRYLMLMGERLGIQIARYFEDPRTSIDCILPRIFERSPMQYVAPGNRREAKSRTAQDVLKGLANR